MCTKSQLEAIEEEMVNYYRSVYGDSIDTITYTDLMHAEITPMIRI